MIRSIFMAYMTVYANSTTAVFFPGTGWMDTGQITKMRAIWELVNLNGNLQIAPAYQLADTESSPGTATALITAVSTTGFKFPSAWVGVGVPLDGKVLFRLGWLVSLTSGTTLATGLVGGKIELFQGS